MGSDVAETFVTALQPGSSPFCTSDQTESSWASKSSSSSSWWATRIRINILPNTQMTFGWEQWLRLYGGHLDRERGQLEISPNVQRCLFPSELELPKLSITWNNWEFLFKRINVAFYCRNWNCSKFPSLYRLAIRNLSSMLPLVIYIEIAENFFYLFVQNWKFLLDVSSL